MQLEIVFSVALISYLLGAISFARLVTRWLSGRDVTEFTIDLNDRGEGHRVASIGANAASMKLGSKGGGLVGLLDILKVAAPTLAVRLLLPEQPYHLVAAVAGMVGHNWPIYHRFHGGSGFSPALGGLLVIDPLGAVALPILGTALGLVVFRSLVAASLSWLWLLIPWVWLRGFDGAHLIYAVTINGLFLLAMIPEIQLARRYQREGKLDAYGAASLEATPMGRGMLKMAARLGIKLPTRQP